MWRMMKQAILDCEYVPGVDVGDRPDPACSELENAYREERGEPDPSVCTASGAIRARSKWSATRYWTFTKGNGRGIPVLSIEDGFGERDHQGWKNLMKELGDKIFIIGDDLSPQG